MKDRENLQTVEDENRARVRVNTNRDGPNSEETGEGMFVCGVVQTDPFLVSGDSFAGVCR